jgi:hypothetical protein
LRLRLSNRISPNLFVTEPTPKEKRTGPDGVTLVSREFASNSFKHLQENNMGLLEEMAGAVIAVEGVKKLDPNAGILEEGAAAVAGFEGTEALVNHFEKKDENQG